MLSSERDVAKVGVSGYAFFRARQVQRAFHGSEIARMVPTCCRPAAVEIGRLVRERLAPYHADGGWFHAKNVEQVISDSV